ncbi:MAG: aminotransferase class V-fold PLP-dependent enzyme [Rhodospirillales bacterium]|nr:MAG: aminotransferase class V-fold PLP-dependent enzyme [Rhodospirillales bacterium]
MDIHLDWNGVAPGSIAPGSAAMRALFPLDPAVTQFNHGGYGVTPLPVSAARDAWRRRVEANPTAFFFQHDFVARVRAAAGRVAGLLGGRGEDWVFVPNATAGLNAVIQAVDLAPGDEILLTDHGYNAVKQAALRWTARAGAAVRVAALPWPDATADGIVAAISAGITSRTRLVIVDHITSPTSLTLPVARIAALCRDAGMPLAVDGAHAPGHIAALDAPSLGADVYVGNLHKWAYAPRALGALWASPAWQTRLHPTVISHGYGQGFTAEFDWQGTVDPTPVLTVDAAFAFAEALGRGRLAAWSRATLDVALPALMTSLGSNATTPAELRAPAMATIALPESAGVDVDAAMSLRRRMRERHGAEIQIVPFAGRLWLRVCATPYLDVADFERLARALRAEIG